jgi:hypothetical protein
MFLFSALAEDCPGTLQQGGAGFALAVEMVVAPVNGRRRVVDCLHVNQHQQVGHVPREYNLFD